jgi:hypothetical protein
MAGRRGGGSALLVLGGILLLFLLIVTCSELGSWDRLRGNLLLRELEANYNNRLSLSVNPGALSAALSDFPVLVVLNAGRTVGYPPPEPGYIHFIYIDELNTAFKLDYEIELWDPGGDSYIWVRVPEIKPDGLTTFWLYYNSTSPGQPENPAGVWRDGYELVYHFGEEGVVSDSTGHGYEGEASGSPVPAAGAIGPGFRLEDITRTYVDTGYKADLTAWTLETWVKGDSPPGTTVAADVYTGPVIGGERYNIVWDHSDALSRGTLMNRDGLKLLTATFGSPIVGGVSYYLAGTYTTGGKFELIRAYTDGAFVSEVLVKKPPLVPVTSPICLGCSDGSLQVLNGVVDEVRVSSVTRSGEYIYCQYLSMTDSLLGYDPPEPL